MTHYIPNLQCSGHMSRVNMWGARGVCDMVGLLNISLWNNISDGAPNVSLHLLLQCSGCIWARINMWVAERVRGKALKIYDGEMRDEIGGQWVGLPLSSYHVKWFLDLGMHTGRKGVEVWGRGSAIVGTSPAILQWIMLGMSWQFVWLNRPNPSCIDWFRLGPVPDGCFGIISLMLLNCYYFYCKRL